MLFGAPTNLAVAYLCQKFAPCLSNIAAPVPTKLPYTHDGEALGIGVKFWEGGVLVSVLVAFQLTAKSQGGSEIAQVLLEVLMEQLDVKRAQLLSSARDGVAANSVAMSLLSAVYKNHVTLLCMPHGCNNIGGAAVLLFLTNIVNLHTAGPSAIRRSTGPGVLQVVILQDTVVDLGGCCFPDSGQLASVCRVHVRPGLVLQQRGHGVHALVPGQAP